MVSDRHREFCEFVDWTSAWKPFGVPPAAKRSGLLTYTNALYAYTLQFAAKSLVQMGRTSIDAEYHARADNIVQALQNHCFDIEFFTDGLAHDADPSQDYSPHSQIWAMLCGAASGSAASRMLERSLSGKVDGKDLSFNLPLQCCSTNYMHFPFLDASIISCLTIPRTRGESSALKR